MKIGDRGNSNRNYDKSCDNDNEMINDLNNYINKNNDAIEILSKTLDIDQKNYQINLEDVFQKINGKKKINKNF